MTSQVTEHGETRAAGRPPTGPSSTGPSSTGPSSTGPSSTGPSSTGTAGVRFAGRGWAYPVGVAANGGIATVGGVANIEKAMRIVLATYLGERPMRPNFGSLLRDFVFAGVTEDNAKAIGAEVRRALFECEPRARVDDVAVTVADGVDGRFDIDIAFTVLESNSSHNLVVPFYAIPGEED